ncbi:MULTISPECIES: S9 family peptidase [unclassified Caulobacter]|uniref:S9 family peptidase n=1 Tax=unclassified Caulobacter TaxID=2648921 RepID=UPI0006F8FB16|nr:MULTISPECIES: S9 family peptidase [unclassified Caulobacter]KQV58359.1 peptidase S9 [Caulobacter sp. Root342]KQV69134.1 peptidase S9 [Caulobacter sp. Root343]
MIKPSLTALAAVLALSSPAMAEKLTPERIFADPGLSGPTAKGVALSPDGKRVTYLKGKPEAANVQDLWAADVKGGEPYRLIDSAALSSGAKELSEAEKARRERARVSARGIVEYSWDRQGRFILVPLDGDLYLDSVADGKVTRLTQTGGDEVDAKVSPKGGFVSYVRDQNLYIKPLSGGDETALTTDGKDALSFGTAEFIAQEELDRFTGYWWSPDEARIVYTRVDESGVDVVPRADIGPGGATVVSQRYPRAGRPNAVVDLFVRDLASGKVTALDLGANKDIYVARVDWSADGKTVYVQRLSRDQKTLDLLAFDAATGAGKTILTDTDPHFIEVGDDFRPLKDGTFLWSSEKDGDNHLYRHAADGKLIAQVTKGDWPVAGLEGVDEARKVAIFAASMDSPLERRIYEVSYAKPGKPKALTAAGGWWTAKVAETGGAFAGTYNDPKTPPQTALYAPDGKRVRWIEENRLAEGHPYWPYASTLPVPEYGTLKAVDGEVLYYEILKPQGFDAAKKYPAIVSVYGGPHAQKVNRTWQSPSERTYLEAGYVIFKLDNRGSGNRSAKFKRALDRKLGTVEVDDQLLGAKFLAGLPYVDPGKLGVMGWSYGGFMTLMLLTADNTPFKAGAAGAPPTEWSLYDTAYTERYMGKPDENKAGYAYADINTRIGKLAPGSLLLLHGMADDNVIFENSTRLMSALQKQAIPFETMLYPGERHSAPGSKTKGLHVLKTHLSFFDRRLRGE